MVVGDTEECLGFIDASWLIYEGGLVHVADIVDSSHTFDVQTVQKIRVFGSGNRVSWRRIRV